MKRYRMSWNKIKEPESIFCLIVGVVTGAMLIHPGTGFVVDLAIISVVSGLTNWWLSRVMNKHFPEDENPSQPETGQQS